MAAKTVRNGKGHHPVASSAKLPLEDPIHADRIRPLFHDEYGRMAALTVQPLSVGGVGEDDVWNRVGFSDVKNDIEVQH